MSIRQKKKSSRLIEEKIYCKSCKSQIHLPLYRQFIEKTPLFCDECLSQIQWKLQIRKIHGTQIMFLYDYDGLIKKLLMEYKEYGNIDLAKCFLYYALPFIKLFTLNSLFIPLPSSKERIEKRGFNHLPLILKENNLNALECLSKEDYVEQKMTYGQYRFTKKNIHLIDGCELPSNKQIVLFDDVFTSGSTFFQSVKAFKEANIKSIKGLILMDNDGNIKHKMN